MGLPDDLELWQPPRLLGMQYDDLMRLFGLLSAPAVDEMSGEYAGYDYLGHTEASFLASYGRLQRGGGCWWLGKSFSSPAGEGYNRLLTPQGVIERKDRFGVTTGPSLVDGRPALVLTYRRFVNEPGSMDLIDDVRRVREGLYLAVATAATADGGRTAPEPFVLAGPATPWVGVDDPALENAAQPGAADAGITALEGQSR